MCVNWVSTLVTVSLVSAASAVVVGVQSVPEWILVLSALTWVGCFCADALYTFRFGRETILRHESNAVFRVLYSRLGGWSAPAHFLLECAGVAALSLTIGHISSNSLDTAVLSVGAMLVLAGEHATAFFENRAFARRVGDSPPPASA